jgi:hypothetical protein
LSSLAWASGCSVSIPNIEFCRIKGKYGATCARWLDAKKSKRHVTPAEWNQKSVGMVCTSEKGMGNVNAIIERLCQNQECVERIGELIRAIE